MAPGLFGDQPSSHEQWNVPSRSVNHNNFIRRTTVDSRSVSVTIFERPAIIDNHLSHQIVVASLPATVAPPHDVLSLTIVLPRRLLAASDVNVNVPVHVPGFAS